MPIHSSDIKLRKSKVMADVDEGGGGPAAGLIEWGQSNTMFDDVSTLDRTVGNTSIRQAHMHVDTLDTARLLGAYAIIAKLPADPNVSVALAQCAPFARRSEIATAIANYLIRGVTWAGYLMENHVQGQGNIQIFGRPGWQVPTIGRTLALVVNEGQINEAVQYLRVIDVEVETRTFTDDKGDFPGQVIKCTLQSPLSRAFPGSAPNRYYTATADSTRIRDTTEADAANYYGAAALTAAGAIGDTTLKVSSIYTQLVPSSTTSVPVLDQRPAAVRSITLASAPRQVDVAVAGHMSRVKVSQENRGLSYITQLTPLPEPGTLVVTWVGLGNRYTLTDDGTGALAGAGVGTVNPATGSVAITLPSLPDVGTAIVFQWGERTAYTNRSGQGAQIRLPEYAFRVDAPDEDARIVASSFSIGYPSGGILRTVTDDGLGKLTGAGTGVVDYPSRSVLLRPQYMPDPGAELLIECEVDAVAVEIIPATSYVPDAAGFISLTLAQQPAAGTLSISWCTARQASTTSGATLTTTTASKTTDVTYTIRTVPEYYEPSAGTVSSGVHINWPQSS